VTVTLTELAQDERGRFRVEGAATLGDGTRKVLGIDPDLDQARAIALHKAKREERWLAANETHTLEELSGVVRDGIRILKAPDGELVEATSATVNALLAAGYVETDSDMPEGTPKPRRRRKTTDTARASTTRTLSAADAEAANAEADLEPRVDEMD
jgi:hypothetical protein